MIKSRVALERELTDTFFAEASNKNMIRSWIFDAANTYGMPEKISSDYITLRRTVANANVFALFILTDVVYGPLKIQKYFSEQEIESFHKSKWYIEKIEFPIRYDMTKITDEQYIGRISAKELMLLGDAQLINYNEKAQRTMKHIVKGEMEFFQIALNKNAVNAIMESFERDLYIPNTITLNIPDDADFYYDVKKKQLVIKSLKCFDILDGYHRYIALSKIHAMKKDFDYEMELRIVQFSESKAKRFIWQEDQKTKMRKVDSDSMDSTKISNKIVERMNSDGSFVLAGKISRNNGIINAAYLANIIDMLVLRDIKKSEELIAMIKLTKELILYIEDLVGKYPEYLSKEWSKKFLYTVVYEYTFGSLDTLVIDYEKINEDSSIYASTKLTKADITRTHKLLKRTESL